MKKSIIVSLLFFLQFGLSQAQVALMNKADSLFKKENWEEAAKAYKKITEENPNPKIGITFNRLGVSYYHMDQFQEATIAFRRAIEISRNPSVMYSLACAFNKLNKKDSCYSWLNRAAVAGFNQYQHISEDGELINLKDDPRFIAVLQKIKLNAFPCLSTPQYRLLDFWIGKWKVYDSKTKQLAGHSEITNVLGECVIMENWQPTQGKAGKSLSMYNAVEKKWRQTYVDESGTFSEYYDGEFKEEGMHFKLRMAIGSIELNELSFYKRSDREVQQVGKVSKDNGVTWQILYDLTYVRE